MIKHIVLFRIKGNGEKKKENTSLFKDKLDELKNKIPEIKHIETGINISESLSSFDLILTTHFINSQDLDTYRNHPDHQKVVKLIEEVASEVAVVDYTI